MGGHRRRRGSSLRLCLSIMFGGVSSAVSNNSKMHQCNNCPAAGEQESRSLRFSSCMLLANHTAKSGPHATTSSQQRPIHYHRIAAINKKIGSETICTQCPIPFLGGVTTCYIQEPRPCKHCEIGQTSESLKVVPSKKVAIEDFRILLVKIAFVECLCRCHTLKFDLPTPTRHPRN